MGIFDFFKRVKKVKKNIPFWEKDGYEKNWFISKTSKSYGTL